MTKLIPVFKKADRHDLIRECELEFSMADNVAISLPLQEVSHLDPDLDAGDYKDHSTIEYETNRYDVTMRDPVMRKTISVYVYMNEDSNFIFAVDGVVADKGVEGLSYPIEETPLWDIFSPAEKG